MDDVLLLALAVAFLAAHLIIWEWHMATDYAPLNAQVDASLQTMAKAVAQLKVHVDTLATPNNDAATVAAIVARLKAGTDQLDAAIAAAQAAVASTSS
jgi:hypothetical protein